MVALHRVHLALWKSFYVMLDITVRILYEQGFPGRPGAPGSKVMLRNISRVYMTAYTSDNECEYLLRVSVAQRKPTAAGFLFWPGSVIIIVGGVHTIWESGNIS